MTSLLLTIQPVGSVVLAAAIFGEDPTGLQLVGVLAVLGGLVLVTARRPSRAVAQEAGTARAGP
jgi:drug/metabolite transporter (DMT)-like permease